MSWLTWALLGFVGLRLSVAIVNWLAQPYLPRFISGMQSVSLSVLIPARNEAHNIGKLLEDLLALNNRSIEILVYDDFSTDNTCLIVEEFKKKNSRIKLIKGRELPQGWLGKNHACHQLSQRAKGDYLLFLDADVRISSGLIENSIFYMSTRQLNLLSIFPKQDLTTLASKMSVPLMNWILLSLLPLPLVRLSGWKSFSGANGQFMLFESLSYKSYLPHQHFKSNPVEDIAILRFYKGLRLKVSTLLGDDRIKCVMYSDLDSAINGFSKNIFQFFGSSVLLTLSFAFITTFTPVLLLMVEGLELMLLYLIFELLIRVFVSMASKQSVSSNVILSVPQQIILWQIISQALYNKKHNTATWKGRTIL